MVESEFKASDMILRVPAPRRRSEAQGHRRVPRHASAPPHAGEGPGEPLGRAARVRTTTPRRATPGTRPDPVDGAVRPGGRMGRGHHLHPHVGRIRVSGHRSGLLLPEKVVGYAMADNMKTDLICKAIDMAVRRCPHQEEVTIFHSDRGSQYTS